MVLTLVMDPILKCKNYFRGFKLILRNFEPLARSMHELTQNDPAVASAELLSGLTDVHGSGIPETG